MTQPPDKLSQEWGAEWAERLWDGLFARYDPLVDGQVVLDLGCSWGYTLKFLCERFTPEKLIGVDVRPIWEASEHGWDFNALGGLVEFHAGQFSELDAIAPASVDLVISSSTLQYMTPEEVELNISKAFSVLRPGGEMILRTRTATSHIGADLHRLFDLPYAHLLYGRSALELVAGEADVPLRYLNFLTASTYLAVFAHCGFEALDVVRRGMVNPDRELFEDRVREALPGVADNELFCADLDARLVKAIDPEDLAALGA